MILTQILRSCLIVIQHRPNTELNYLVMPYKRRHKSSSPIPDSEDERLGRPPRGRNLNLKPPLQPCTVLESNNSLLPGHPEDPPIQKESSPVPSETSDAKRQRLLDEFNAQYYQDYHHYDPSESQRSSIDARSTTPAFDNCPGRLSSPYSIMGK